MRVALAGFVLTWIFGPNELRTAVPIWVVFLIALGLELNFFVGALRAQPGPRPDRTPLAIDRERYGYASETDELLVVDEDGEELWIPYSGEEGDAMTALVADARNERVEADAPVTAGRDRRRPLRPLHRLLAGLGVIGALAAIFWLEGRTGWNGLTADTQAKAEARFSAEASRIVGKRVSIGCDESGKYVGAVQHADGVAEVGGNLAYLTPERCYDLYRLAFESEVTSSQTARAIAVLAHEAWHLRGERDEGTTECYALQSGVALGQRLGLSERTARQMMRQQLTENALRSRGSFEYLVPPQCRNGGSLDLDPESGQFP